MVPGEVNFGSFGFQEIAFSRSQVNSVCLNSAGNSRVIMSADHALPYLPQWFCPFVENVEIATVYEETVPLTTGGLFENAKIDHMA